MICRIPAAFRLMNSSANPLTAFSGSSAGQMKDVIPINPASTKQQHWYLVDDLAVFMNIPEHFMRVLNRPAALGW